MGQYHYIVNIDKKQFLHPHKFGDGLKLREFGCSGEGTMTGLAYLLAVSASAGGRGGGDPHTDAEGMIGSWGGDRIVIIGDYAEVTDLPVEMEADKLYHRCADGDGYTDISDVVMALLKANGDTGQAS